MSRLFFFLVALSFGFLAHAGGALPAEAKEVLAETQGASAVAGSPAATVKEAAASADEKGGEATKMLGDKSNLKESEIPLNFDKKKQSSEEASPFARAVLGMLVLAAMLGGVFIYVRRKAKPGARKNAPQIKVLTQHWMGPKKSLAIIRVAGESILVGVTEHNISMIKSLSLLDEEIPVETPSQFNHVLNESNLRNEDMIEASASGGGHAGAGGANGTADSEEEFQFSGLNQIKDVVHRRLKGMRSLQ